MVEVLSLSVLVILRDILRKGHPFVMLDLSDLVVVPTTTPAARNHNLIKIPTRAIVQQWLSQAQQLNLTDPTLQKGVLFLEYLLVSLTPKETGLLPNYPNPFNPETWIPYQLAQSVDVTIFIYTVDGKVIRTLSFGHKPSGVYQDKTRAAYWDGKK